MVERMLLYPRHIGALRAVRASIHTVVAGLAAERLTSSEPVPFEEALNAEFEPTRKGEIWGGLYDCCLFRFRGEVPASAKGKHVVLIIDTEGEGLARDMTAGGAPMQGLTHIMSAIDAVQSVPGKRVVEFLDCAEGGERVDVMVDAGFNDIVRKHKKVRLGKAVIAVRDDLAVRYYYDYLVLFQLLLTLGKNKNLTSADAREIDSLLRRSYAAWGRDRQVAAAMLEERLNTPNGAAVNEYAAVGHAHLDLAWLWPLRETHRKAARTFATALKNIERYPRYIFGASQAQISNVAVISDEWVGFGDSIDFQRIVFDAAGSYSFRISGLEGKAKLTVWEYNDKGQLKSLKNISVTPKMDKNGNWSVQSGELKPLLLEGGKEYFVSVEATNWKKGEGSGYDVTVSGEVFNNPGNALLNSTWDAADVKSITPGTTVADEWVGYGDANDFFSLTLGADDAGSYLFRLSTSAGLNGNATLNVYQKQDDGKGGFKLKSVGKFTNTKSDSITLDLESGDYFVEVMSADKGKGKKNTDYVLDVTKLASPDPVAALSSFDGVTAAMQSLAMDSLAGSGLASEALTGSSLEEKNR